MSLISNSTVNRDYSWKKEENKGGHLYTCRYSSGNKGSMPTRISAGVCDHPCFLTGYNTTMILIDCKIVSLILVC